MCFGPWRNRIEVRIDGCEVPIVYTTKFLGVHIDDKLNWDTHIALLYNRLQANKHSLRLALNLLDTHILRLLYYAHIHSHLSYGITSWGSMAMAKSLKSLYQLQKQCI